MYPSRFLESLLPQQQVQHLQQQTTHSAPQQMQRAIQKMTLKAMMPPTMMATMTGHLESVSTCKAGTEPQDRTGGSRITNLQYDFAIQLSHDESVSFASANGSRGAREKPGCILPWTLFAACPQLRGLASTVPYGTGSGPRCLEDDRRFAPVIVQPRRFSMHTPWISKRRVSSHDQQAIAQRRSNRKTHSSALHPKEWPGGREGKRTLLVANDREQGCMMIKIKRVPHHRKHGREVPRKGARAFGSSFR